MRCGALYLDQATITAALVAIVPKDRFACGMLESVPKGQYESFVKRRIETVDETFGKAPRNSYQKFGRIQAVIVRGAGPGSIAQVRPKRAPTPGP